MLALVAGLFLALAIPGFARAAERRQVGPYELMVGWMVEPAIVGVPNGADLRVARSATGAAVSGLQSSLKVEVSFFGQKRTLELQPDGRAAGHYTAVFIPTRAGAYDLRVFGTIESTQVNESFSFEKGLGKVETTEAQGFPESADSFERMYQLGQNLDRTMQQIPAISGRADDAKEDSLLSQRFSVMAMVMGGLAVFLASLAIVLATRRR